MVTPGAVPVSIAPLVQSNATALINDSVWCLAAIKLGVVWTVPLAPDTISNRAR